MALVVGEPASCILLESGDEVEEPLAPLPSWARLPELKPPTMSMERPLDVFDRLAAQGMCFDALANCGDAYQPAECFCCSVCMQFLEQPASCLGCQQAMCTKCWERRRENTGSTDYICPLCRHSQPSIELSRCMQQVLDHELRSKGIAFCCNTCAPGSRPDALWCCQDQFSSLQELRRHLLVAPPFRTTRTSLRRLLSIAISGSEEARDNLFKDPVQRQKLALVLEEDEVVAAVARRRLTALRASGARERSRSPMSGSRSVVESAGDGRTSTTSRRRIVLRRNGS